MLSKTCICTYVMLAINKIPYTPSSSNTGNRLMTTSISRFSFLRKPIPYVHSPIICFSRSNFTNEIGMQYNPLIELSRLFGEFYNSIISSSTRAFSDWFTIFDYTHSLPPEVHARGYWFSIDAEKTLSQSTSLFQNREIDLLLESRFFFSPFAGWSDTYYNVVQYIPPPEALKGLKAMFNISENY